MNCYRSVNCDIKGWAESQGIEIPEQVPLRFTAPFTSTCFPKLFYDKKATKPVEGDFWKQPESLSGVFEFRGILETKGHSRRRLHCFYNN